MSAALARAVAAGAMSAALALVPHPAVAAAAAVTMHALVGTDHHHLYVVDARGTRRLLARTCKADTIFSPRFARLSPDGRYVATEILSGGIARRGTVTEVPLLVSAGGAFVPGYAFPLRLGLPQAISFDPVSERDPWVAGHPRRLRYLPLHGATTARDLPAPVRPAPHAPCYGGE